MLAKISATVLCVLAVGQATAADKSAHQLRTADGRVLSGRLTAIGLDGQVSLTLPDGKTQSLAIDDVSAVELAKPPTVAKLTPTEVWLAGGGTLLGDIRTARLPGGAGGGEAAVGYVGDLGEFAIPLRILRAVRFRDRLPASVPAPARQLFEDAFERARADTERNDDVLLAFRGDEVVQLSGFLKGLDEEKVTFSYGGKDRTLSRSKVYAVVLSGRAAKAAAPANAARITAIGGSTAELEVRELREGQWRLIGPPGLELTLPTAALARIEFRNRRVLSLSDTALKKGSARTLPTLGGDWPVLENVNPLGEPLKLGGQTVKGLCVKPTTEIKYDLVELGADFNRFAAVLGVDDAAARAESAVVFEVLANGKSVFKSAAVGAIAAGSKPIDVSIDLTNVKVLVLRVTAAEGALPAGQWAVWGDARLLRK